MSTLAPRLTTRGGYRVIALLPLSACASARPLPPPSAVEITVAPGEAPPSPPLVREAEFTKACAPS